MGLSTSLSNALSGMNTSQSSLEILSRNVSNAGTPGYHRQSLSVVDTAGTTSTSVRSGGLQRAFNASLQVHYNTAASDSGYSSTMSAMLDQLQSAFGTPGDAGSLDTMYSSLQTSLQSLSTSPDNYSTRATVVSQAQEMAATLNTLSQQVQDLRQQAESEISSNVDTLNQSIQSLAKVNTRLMDQSIDDASRASLMDQRDRLVADIAGIIDVKVDYRSDDTVSLMTNSGIGILDGQASTFAFQSGGKLTADKQYNTDPSKSGVGRLSLVTPSGLTIDMAQEGVLQSGTLGALLELRDDTLVAAQDQLDEIAAGLAQAFSTTSTSGTAATSGTKSGFSLDLSEVRDGNDVVVNYSKGGTDKTIRLVRVNDTSKLPLDYVDANGARVVGVDFSGGATAVAAKLSAALGSGFTVSGSGSTLTVLDDGSVGNTDVGALTARTTSSGLQDGDPAFSLFVDRNDADFTNSLGGDGQKLGFAGRISVNSAVVTDNTLLVKSSPGGSLGDPSRANYVLDQLGSMSFASGQSGPAGASSFRLGGTVSDLISQTMNHVGSIAESASDDDDTNQLTMSSLTDRMDSEYGVNVDDEMARLLELQNAYAANSRVISAVQELMNRLMDL